MEKKIKLYRIKTCGIYLGIIVTIILSIMIVVNRYIDISNSIGTSMPASYSLLWFLVFIPLIIIELIGLHKFRKSHREIYKEFLLTKKLYTKKQKVVRVIRRLVIALSILLCILISAPFIGLHLYVNRHVNYRGYETPNYPLQGLYEATEYGINEKQMFLTTEDGYEVWCSEIGTSNPKGVIIYLTGIMQPSITYFYGHASWMEKNGYASILLEVRGHGKSEGNKICFGYEEYKDVQAVVDYIKHNEEYKDIPIIIQGVSMGGAIAINSFGQIPDIDVLIAMSPYSSFEDEVVELMNLYHIPKWLQALEMPFIKQALIVQYGQENVENMTPEKQIQRTEGRSILLVACTGDEQVPYTNTLRLQKANPEVNVWIKDSWEHFIVNGCDFRNVMEDTEYCDRILKFIEESID